MGSTPIASTIHLKERKMIEAAKELLEIVKHAPEYTMWVLIMILFYKVFIVGSWMAIARLAIIKVHDIVKNRSNKKIIKYDYGMNIYSHDGADVALNSVLYKIKAHKSKNMGSVYNLNKNDIAWLSDAVEAKISLEEPKK